MPNGLKEFNSETLTEIFSNLSIKQALGMRQVCKKWLKIINQIRFNKLILVQSQQPLNEGWSDQQSIDPTSLLNVNKNKIENQLKSIFLNLKELYVFIDRNLPLTVECLNSLRLLERLHLKYLKLDEQRTLELPALRELKIRQMFGCGLVLDCPELEKLCCPCYAKNEIEVRHPDRIRFLECADFTFNIRQFINLECLTVYVLDNLENPSFYLTELRKLRQIHFLWNNYALVNLFCQKFIHKRHDLDIFFQGVKIDETCEFAFKNYSLPTDALDGTNIDFYLSNYSNTASVLPFIRRFYYTEFDAKVAFGVVPKQFIDKFTNINVVYASRRVWQEERFLAFLAHCRHSLSTLRLCNTSLTSSFYERLAATVPGLTHLELIDEEDVLGNIDYTFLFKLKFLMEFATNKCLALDFVCLLLQRLAHLKMLCFMNEVSDAKLFKFRNCVELVQDKKFTYFKTLKDLLLHFDQ